MKRIITLIMTIAFCASLAGCRVDTKENEVNTDLTLESTVEATVESTVKPTVESQGALVALSKTNKVASVINVNFEEEFTIKKGQKAQVGKDKVVFEMTNSDFLQFDGYSNTQVFYSLTASGKTYTGGCSFFSNNEALSWIDQHNPYNVIVVSGTMDSITVKVQKAVYPDKPLKLSGKSTDKFVTKKLEYIETKRFIVYLDSGVTVEGDLIKNINKIMTDIESETGLSFNSYLTGEKMLDDSKEVYYKNYRKFTGVDPEAKKISIYVVNSKDVEPNGSRGSVVVTSTDILFHDSDNDIALIHELVHCVHLSNGKYLGQTFTEGYATYITKLIIDKENDDNFSRLYNQNYSNYENKITAKNAEQLFLTESGWNSYLYGYRFMTYIMETYDKETFIEILNEFPAGWMNPEPSNEEVAQVIKEKTSDTVFKDFGAWYVKNVGRFE